MATFMALGLEIQPLDPARRTSRRAEHRQYLTDSEDRIICASAVLDDERRPCGSLYLLSATSADEVRAWLADDPFVIDGLYESWVIREVFDRGDWWTLPRKD